MAHNLIESISNLEERVRKVVVSNLDTAHHILEAKQKKDFNSNLATISVPEWYLRYLGDEKFAKVRNGVIPHQEFYHKLFSQPRHMSLAQATDLITYAEDIAGNELWSYDVTKAERETSIRKRFFGLRKEKSITEKEKDYHYHGINGSLPVRNVNPDIEALLQRHPSGEDMRVRGRSNQDLGLFSYTWDGCDTFKANFWIGVFGTEELDISQINALKTYSHIACGEGGIGDEYSTIDRMIIYHPLGSAIYDKMKIGEPVAFIEGDKIFVLGENKQPRVQWTIHRAPFTEKSRTYYDIGDGKTYVAGEEPGTLRELTDREIKELRDKDLL